MHTLPTPFTIEINGLPIAPPTAGADSPPQATLGTADNAAKFSLKDGVLECEGWMLGRNKTEDRSLLPKKVAWFRVGETEREQVHPVAVEKSGDGEEYKPMFHGAHLQEQDGSVFANLMEGEHSDPCVMKHDANGESRNGNSAGEDAIVEAFRRARAGKRIHVPHAEAYQPYATRATAPHLHRIMHAVFSSHLCLLMS
ncbi:hypothetical protein SNOG_05555 [Parastagonospora nodorum SN15]|uniref:Uncharacterized protein n=1 Tax=Phaeosphaeria nodorum (strain SN15 / ATCC MYA-4574 / FGSC 10173) TaxID=321614 RepID=Q0URQ9_PHANO|nr:hypothetical protein SNOG_05555 [Parastagonospora nodorum SN15]EAT86619.2 hypothetical protein SNOG_05555 [Parastagonospora nodorum SN15]